VRSFSSVVALVLGCAGCERFAKSDAALSASASSSAAPTARLITERPLSSPSAFALAATAQGLHVLWAGVEPTGGWLSDVELGHDGAPRSKARVLPLPPHTLGKVTDLSASFDGEELALAWLEQGKGEARAQASVTRGQAAPQLLDLGPAAVTAESARGNVAVATEAERGRALVMWRGLEAPCIEPQSSACVGFTFRRIQAGAAEPTGLPLSVPVPCASHSVQLSVSSGRFHYGVCTRDGADPVTTMFSIQYAPEYARAEPLLKGCSPLGTVSVQDMPWLIADCHGVRKAVAVPVADEQPQPAYVDALEMRCTPERAELSQGHFRLVLREPRAGLQSLLGPRLLPTGALAGWTGKSLVLVYLVGTRLETRTLACRAGVLQPL
jgi:hypothetical protein